MKKLVGLCVLVFSLTYAQENIESRWYTAGNDSQVEIYKSNGKYFGKIVYLKEPYFPHTIWPPQDAVGKLLLGREIFDVTKQKGDAEAEGKIYNPGDGKTYNARVIPEADSLTIKIKMTPVSISWKRISGSAESIAGTYMTEENDTKIEVTQIADRYKAKIIWMKKPEKINVPVTDIENPNEARRNIPLIGLLILKDFVYDAQKDMYSGGTIYNPDDGKTYYCTMKMLNNGSLEVKGSLDRWGVVGKKQIWKRVR